MSTAEIENERDEIEDNLHRHHGPARSAQYARLDELKEVLRQRVGNAGDFAGAHHDLRKVQQVRLEQQRQAEERWVSLAAFYHAVLAVAHERGVEPPITRQGLTKRLIGKRRAIVSRRPTGPRGDWEIELGSMMDDWRGSRGTRHFRLPDDMHARIQAVEG